MTYYVSSRTLNLILIKT